jgi:adenine-specific DNA methylase
MLMALLLPDPCDGHCPPEFKERAQELLRPIPGIGKTGTDEELRKGLLKFIADFANWDRSADAVYLECARGLVRAAHGEEPPLVVDPFAGGGSIPLEALRIGCDAFASDLNPVACLILKVLLEDIPRHGPELADDLAHVGRRVKEQAELRLSKFYPDDSDGSRPIAYLWARTVRCEAPKCGAEVPLMSFWLCRRSKRKWALRHRIVTEKGQPPQIEFSVFQPSKESDVHEATISRARAACLCCGSVLPPERVRAQLQAQAGGANVVFDAKGRRIGGARLLVVVTLSDNSRGRSYRVSAEADYRPVFEAERELQRLVAQKQSHSPSVIPEEPLPFMSGTFNVPLYGMTNWGSLFANR